MGNITAPSSHDSLDDCSDCSPGKYGDQLGATACKVCSEATFTNGSGALFCVPVQPGHRVVFTNETTTCPSDCYGQTCDDWDEVYGQIDDTCDYAGDSLASVYDCTCSGCTCNTETSTPLRIGETPCLKGTFSLGAESCSACEDGYVAVDEGAAACEICPAGTVPNADKSLCTDCPVGTLSTKGAVQCTDCPAGYYQSQSGSSS